MAHDHHDPHGRQPHGGRPHGEAAVQASHAHAAAPGLSLLRMSVPQRLLGVGALLGLLWLGVLWALN